MDRRNFLKVSAITSASAALVSCGHPEHQIIRFIPEDTLVPGVAEWRPSLCTLCGAGCGVLVRVMEGDAEVVRDGRAGVIKMGLAKKLEVLSTAMWGSWVEISPKTAERLEIRRGELVEVASRHGRLQTPALISPGVAPDVVAIPIGQGHEHFTRYASGRGVNPVTFWRRLSSRRPARWRGPRLASPSAMPAGKDG